MSHGYWNTSKSNQITVIIAVPFWTIIFLPGNGSTTTETFEVGEGEFDIDQNVAGQIEQLILTTEISKESLKNENLKDGLTVKSKRRKMRAQNKTVNC